jgi:acyl carrier protein
MKYVIDVVCGTLIDFRSRVTQGGRKGTVADHAGNRREVRSAVREYLLSDVLSGEDPDALKDTTELVSSGILDSISTARLVSYLEEEFGVRFKASEIGAAHLNTVDLIVRTVESKRQA